MKIIVLRFKGVGDQKTGLLGFLGEHQLLFMGAWAREERTIRLDTDHATHFLAGIIPFKKK